MAWLQASLLELTSSAKFQALMAVMILLNTAAMTWQADCDKSDSDRDTAARALGAVFLLIFTIELVMRLIGHGFCGFLCHPRDGSWNAFDLVVVLLSGIDELFTIVFGTSSSQFPSLLRMLRILRILRVLRLFRQLQRLRLLARGLVESLRVVFWVMSLLAIINFIAAIFCTNVIGRNARKWGSQEAKILELWGSVYRSFVTLFQVLTLDDWGYSSRLVQEQLPWMQCFFIPYVVVAAFVILSLLTGVMADHMNQVNNAFHEDEARFEQDELAEVLSVFNAIFTRLDTSGNGVISRKEFSAMFRRADIQAELSRINVDLPHSEAKDLFDCFDTDGDGKLSWVEFRNGLEEVRHGVTPQQIAKLGGAMQRAICTYERGQGTMHSRGLDPDAPSFGCDKLLHEVTARVDHLESRLRFCDRETRRAMRDFSTLLRGRRVITSALRIGAGDSRLVAYSSSRKRRVDVQKHV